MEKSRKILIFSTAYYPFVGGAEVAVKEITDRVSSVEFDLITARFKRDLPKFQRIGNINVYRIGLSVSILDKLLLPFWGAILALNLNRKTHYDFFWCIMATFGSGAAYIVNLIHFWEQTSIILTLQEGDSEEHFKTRWFGLINLSWRLALKNTNILTTISSYLGNRAKRLGYKGEIKIIPNGVDVKRFDINQSQDERLKIRKGLGLEEKDIALITTSRLTLKNGVGDVIKALPNLPGNTKFIIFGEGHLDKGLRKLAKDLKVSERVIFRGHVSHSEMPKYLKACDIFIRPSLSEGMGNSFIEAMAAKLPVVATPVGGITDFVFEASPNSEVGRGQTGYFCKPENPKSVVETVKRVISDNQKNEIIENAYKMVKEKYDWDIVASQMKEVFDKIKKISI
ncbi:MAG: hypothetical protein A3E02_00850 [Candidatus Zambryskibacteria bacterium RIFCSPHIGHO2_12_FULL_38_34]|uniref:Uncharacterized protein n=1 Tax=Candidatus Zambryskibacteria bacterium RIFCSPLOWO2_12_FULL_39_16 TaxID=1802775 RepID=A0A1G2UQV3_9BACT|nr:MAG: hypothetical protein A3D37_01415 [Candidatus Zambryskibacteria bacterium RIFCSPHIGHO2_02_FULL_38_22]OHA97345.1 MAG: hypothetical protein A3E02_00850 [Candidatus Zambryskibacteria bacterium RIFCSPHIGHO2_12_FULL_38_34]OHB08211.1 MAG: hypothetical protein A3I19_01795 [Candidatus Zambryskibacteria bacterium RIFCSPLOWO2_02_FULL_38_13]OHB11753.1 MAG: hypothetical protein A3G46_01415 [Candidatus Zambryskibacteria bacterium RIFCSPLOWO2_12_FULL_39_16]